MAESGDAPHNFDQKLRQREATQTRNPISITPQSRTYEARGRIPNTPLAASTISFLLGIVFTGGTILFLNGGLGYWWSTYQLGFFIASWAAFHWGEFAVTAGWNLEKCSIDSFLLENGNMYHIAHSVAIIEHVAVNYFKPSWKQFPYVTIAGIFIVVLGQILRSTAMIHAATSFSHQVASYKTENHTLVTTGIYKWFRHPSYTGFFYWALGTQLVLQNQISFVGFLFVLWKFFNSRIQVEERYLIRFFGNDYIEYKKRVGTSIPFIA